MYAMYVSFIELVYYCRDMCHKRAHTLAPLKKLCLKKVKFKWTDVENYVCITMIKIVSCDVLLSCPN